MLTVVLAAAFAVSVVHYADNYLNYSAFPGSDTLPNPSRTVVLVSWFVFTATGLAGYVMFRRRPSAGALVLLAVYSGSGLVGVGHYAVPGALDMPPLRQAHVISDILLGAAVLAVVVWAARQRKRHDARARPPRPGR